MTITPTPTARSGERQAGQSLAEFAIVLPVLALILLTVLQVGFLLVTQVGLTNGAREAARNASSIPVATVAQATAASTAYYARLTDAASGFLERNVGGFDAGRLVTVPGTDTGTRVCYYSFTDASGAEAVMARVVVEYRHPLFVPLVSAILDSFDGAADSAWRLSVSEDIRVGNPVLTAPSGIAGVAGDQTCSP